MTIKPMNRKAELLLERPLEDVRPYAFDDCCPGFAPGWEVGSQGAADPCPWQSDLSACHGGPGGGACYWLAQVPDYTTYPNWLDSCGNLATDWTSLPVVGP